MHERRRCAYYYTALTAVAAGVTALPRSFGGGGVTIRRCGNITSAMPNHLVTRPSRRSLHGTQGCNKSLGRGHSRLEMRPTQEFRALPLVVCEPCSLSNGEPFLVSAVMPLCRSVRSATALFCRLFLRLRGSDSDRVMLKLDYTARDS